MNLLRDDIITNSELRQMGNRRLERRNTKPYFTASIHELYSQVVKTRTILREKQESSAYVPVRVCALFNSCARVQCRNGRNFCLSSCYKNG